MTSAHDLRELNEEDLKGRERDLNDQLFRLRIVQQGTHLKQRTTLCAFKLPAVEGVATLVIPPKLQALMQKKFVDSEGDFLSASDATWSPPNSLLVVGAQRVDQAEHPAVRAAPVAEPVRQVEKTHPRQHSATEHPPRVVRCS